MAVYKRMIRLDEELKDVLATEAEKIDRSVNWLINNILSKAFLVDGPPVTQTDPGPDLVDVMTKEPVKAIKSQFDDFWLNYPKKSNKKKSKEIWLRKKLDAKASLIIGDVMRRAENHKPWLDGFIPAPTTYLNGERWEDEIESPTTQSKTFNANEQAKQEFLEMVGKSNEQ